MRALRAPRRRDRPSPRAARRAAPRPARLPTPRRRPTRGAWSPPSRRDAASRSAFFGVCVLTFANVVRRREEEQHRCAARRRRSSTARCVRGWSRPRRGWRRCGAVSVVVQAPGQACGRHAAQRAPARPAAHKYSSSTAANPPRRIAKHLTPPPRPERFGPPRLALPLRRPARSRVKPRRRRDCPDGRRVASRPRRRRTRPRPPQNVPPAAQDDGPRRAVPVARGARHVARQRGAFLRDLFAVFLRGLLSGRFKLGGRRRRRRIRGGLPRRRPRYRPPLHVGPLGQARGRQGSPPGVINELVFDLRGQHRVRVLHRT
mmetsp:Transcript_5161/g.15747  ORF Transcript_5161/g.15747 Transcript_5161/m.15747 type:complete len:317 (-) Transcript_5161:984-1934(-)